MNRYCPLALSTTAALVLGVVSLPAQAQDRSLWLHYGESTTVNGYFVAGETIYGSCDNDCLDMDLYLYDGNTGELVYQDTATDAAPLVVAPWEGDFVVQITMPNCTHPDGCAAWLSSDYGF